MTQNFLQYIRFVSNVIIEDSVLLPLGTRSTSGPTLHDTETFHNLRIITHISITFSGYWAFGEGVGA